MNNEEMTQLHGSNPCRTANIPQEIEELVDSRTDSAQISAEFEPPKMKFPKVIRHRKAVRQSIERPVSLLAAVSEFAEASAKLQGRNLGEVVEIPAKTYSH
jgi:hypothetical protein